MNLRERLYGEPMMKLLADQIAQADELHKQYFAQSNGKWSQTEVIMTAQGVKASDIPSVLAQVLGGTQDENARREMCLKIGFPMHPEHYAVPVPMSVVETMGGLPTLTYIAKDDNPPAFVLAEKDEQYAFAFTGKGTLADGTPHSYVLQQFKDTADGLQASLRIWYPAACPPEYLAEHAEHYTVESRNLFRMIAKQKEQ